MLPPPPVISATLLVESTHGGRTLPHGLESGRCQRDRGDRAGGGGGRQRRPPAPTVREATFDVLRRLGLTTIFSNPGSTEVSFLAGLPEDLEFVLGLHEGSVVGMATGYALGRGAPAFALLHTTPAWATRCRRWPPRASIARRWWSWSASRTAANSRQEPFLAGRLHGLAGEYPVSGTSPCARRTSRARSCAPTTPRRPRAARRS